MSTKEVVLHGNDVSVWVADACGVLIGHSQFIRAACGNIFSHAIVPFHNRSNDRRNYFKRYSDLTLMHGDYELISGKQSHLHFFAIGEAAAYTFMKECDLDNLQFPVQMVGVVLVVERQIVEEFNCTPKFEFDWAKSQHLPIVIAATGYNIPNFSTNKFREQFNLETDTIVVPGPSIDLSLEQGFDTKHARQVVDALYGLIR